MLLSYPINSLCVGVLTHVNEMSSTFLVGIVNTIGQNMY